MCLEQLPARQDKVDPFPRKLCSIHSQALAVGQCLLSCRGSVALQQGQEMLQLCPAWASLLEQSFHLLFLGKVKF